MISLNTAFNKHTRIKTFVFILLLVTFGLFISYKVTLPAAEDLPRQMMNGKDILAGHFDVLYKNVYSYTEPQHQFDNHHWLYGVYSYGMYSLAGFDGIVLFKVFLFLFLLWLLMRISLERSNFWLVALFTIPVAIILMGRAAARPEMFSYLFTVLYLYFLTRLKDDSSDKSVFWIVLLQLLWANTHILFPAGVALVGAFWLEAVILHWRGVLRSLLVRKLTLLLALTVAVSFANPLGINGVLYSLGANTIHATAVFSAEVQSIADVFKVEPRAAYPGAAIFTTLVILLAASFAVGYKKKNIALLVLCAAFTFLSYKIIRGLPMFALVFLPAITSNLDEPYQRMIRWARRKSPELMRFFSVAAPALLIVLLFGTIFIWRHRIVPYQDFGIGLSETSEEPVEFFKKNDLHGPILNDTDIGSYLTWYLYPKEKVFADNRFADAYSREFLEEEYRAMFTDEVKWKEKLEKYQFNTIILNHYDRGDGMSDFIYQRIYDPDWVWVYAGRDAIIFVRNIHKNQAVIDAYAITPDNLDQRLSSLAGASDYAGQVAAADLYAYAGYTKLAIIQYEKIVSKWPHLGKIWFLIGRNELMRGDQANTDSAKALLALQRAIKGGYKTPLSYSYLALAYYRLGDLEAAEAAVKKELRIDPDNNDGKAWQDIFLRERLKRSESSDE